MKSFYENMLNNIRTKHLDSMIIFLEKYSPYVIAFFYIFSLIYLFLSKHPLLLETILKPLFAFLFVTLLRKFINRPRPCITYKIHPLITHKQDQSFPSRHTTSAFSIALALISINPILGLVSMIIASIVALSRILSGVHFISDVFVGILISILIYFI